MYNSGKIRKGKMKIKGFLVILILGVVVVYFIFMVKSGGQANIKQEIDAFSRAKAKLTRTNMMILQRAISSYIASHGQAPERLAEVSLSYPITTGRLDAWGKEIKYKGLSDDKFRLTSAGGDKKFNTEDDIVMEY
jgi:hypothetical protein